jgi:hypothetical protein
MAETHLPVGYPALLASLRWAFPNAIVPLQLVSLLASLGAVLLSASYYRRRLDRTWAWLTTMLLAVHVAVVRFSTLVMAEAVYMLLSFCVLVLVERQEQSELDRRGWYIVIGLLATAAYFVRIFGMTLFGAVVLYYVTRRRWSGVLATTLPFAAAYGLWSRRNSALGSAGVSYGVGSSALLKVPGMMVRRLASPQMAEQWFRNLPDFLVPLMFGPRVTGLLQSVGLGFLSFLMGGLVVLVILVGFVTQVRKRFGVAELYVLAYAAVLVVAPLTERYWLPLAPLIVYYFALGLQSLASEIQSVIGRRSVVQVGAGSVMVALTLLHLGRDVQAAVNPLRNRIPDVAVGASWIARDAPADAVVMARVPRVTYLYSQRTVVPFPGFTAGEVYDPYPSLESRYEEARLYEAIDLLGVDYVLVEPRLASGTPFRWSEYTGRSVVPLLESDPERFSEVFASEDGLVRVYRVHQ